MKFGQNISGTLAYFLNQQLPEYFLKVTKSCYLPLKILVFPANGNKFLDKNLLKA